MTEEHTTGSAGGGAAGGAAGGPEKDSVLGKLGKAGSSLGSLGSKVVKKVREDLTDDHGDGLGKLKADASEATSSLKKADSRDDYLEVGKDFAKDAGSFLKSVADSVKSAVNEVKDSEDADTAKSAFASVVETSRDKLDETVDQVRAKKAERDAARNVDVAESTNEPETDIIDGEVIPNPEDPQEPRV